MNKLPVTNKRHLANAIRALSMDAVQHQPCNLEQVANIARGGYVLKDCEGTPELILLATGSEVELATKAAEQLSAESRRVRVVSMPLSEVFEQQDPSYRRQVLPKNVTARIAVEALHADYWYKYVGLDGHVISMTGYGESAPASELFPLFGITVEAIIQQAESLLETTTTV